MNRFLFHESTGAINDRILTNRSAGIECKKKSYGWFVLLSLINFQKINVETAELVPS